MNQAYSPSSDEMDYLDDYNDGAFSNEDLLIIQEEYRKKRLIESLIGPVVSTIFHVVLIIILAIFITDKYKEEVPEITVLMEEVQEIVIEEPPPIEEPKPIEETADVTNPTLTTVQVENVDTNDTALENVDDNEPSTEDDSNIEAVSDVIISPSSLASPVLFGGRSAAGRASAVSAFGGTKVGQESLMKALWWLAKVQNPDGSWGNTQKEAMTGLAVLTFLAHGETTLSQNFGKNVRNGIQWLVDKVMKNKGKVLGRENNGGNTRCVYSHALVAYALSEATAMIGASQIEEAMNEAVAVIIKGQHENGGFFYNYVTKGPSNLSNASFNFQAMKAAYAAGSHVDGLKAAIDKSVAHLKKYAGKDAFYYRTDTKDPRGPSMRCVGVLCLQLLGEPECEEAIRIGNYIENNDMTHLEWKGESGNKPLAFPLYFWYYGTQVMFQRGGKGWNSWNAKFQKVLTENQFPDGHWESPSAFEADRFNMPGIDKQVYSTTLCALMLTVYYRYLPSYKIPKQNMAKKDDASEKKEEGLDLIE